MKLRQLATCFSAILSGLLLTEIHAEQVAVANESRVNVRGQPSFVGEVITQLDRGQEVVVLEELTLTNPQPGEPERWARIRMPAETPVWVHSAFVDSATQSVKASRLNLRAGPGENYSVVGRLEKGDAIKEVRRVEEWIEIQTPDKAYAFVAASLLTSKGAAPAPAPQTAQAPVPPPVAPIDDPAEEPDQPIEFTEVPAPAGTPAARPEAAPITPEPFIPVSPAPVAAATIPAPDIPAEAVPQPKPRRIVRREGIVRGTLSIQAPTDYELLAPESRRSMNYLHMEKIGTDLQDYTGRTIVVTGEEAVDPRWPNTPLLIVETLKLVL
jgi:SH3-like domain-containing protein